MKSNMKNRSRVDLLIAEPQAPLLMELRNSLQRLGIGRIRDLRSLDLVYEVLDSHEQPDVMILDSSLTWDGRTVAGLIRDLRRGRIGRNPFLPVIATIWTPDQRQVKQLVNAGPDLVLVKPFSTQSLIDRIESVAFQRKDFVVTSDYLGPDRRQKERRGANSADLFEVPNMLNIKLSGATVDANVFAREIDQTQDRIQAKHRQANAYQLAFLEALCHEPLTEGHVDKFVIRNMERIGAIAREMCGMLKASGQDDLVPVAGRLGETVSRLLEGIEKPNLALLADVEEDTSRLLLSLHPGESADALSERVVKSVLAFKNYTGSERVNRPVQQFGG